MVVTAVGGALLVVWVERRWDAQDAAREVLPATIGQRAGAAPGFEGAL